MRIAFLELCHTDPAVVARVADRLTENKNFDVYVHLDAKMDIAPFEAALSRKRRVFFVRNRKKVYWGGYNAVEATIEMMKAALGSNRGYDYFMLLQNLDYPIRSNDYIESFFEQNAGKEFIRGCRIAKSKDWHYARKYRLYNKRDDDFYITGKSTLKRYMRYLGLLLCSVATIHFNGVIKDRDEKIDIYYGAAQWAVTQACARFIVKFSESHSAFNKKMMHIQFPDEEYFHTIVHNSAFRYRCIRYDEPEKRWLVNWRNLHYFEYPREITVFTEKDFEKIMQQDALFVRKVKTGISDRLMDMIDEAVACERGSYGTGNRAEPE